MTRATRSAARLDWGAAPFAGGPVERVSIDDIAWQSGVAKGPRRFPFPVPIAETGLERARDLAPLPALPQPKYPIVGDDDPIDRGRRGAAMLPRATFDPVRGFGHFLRDGAGPEIVAAEAPR